jgi:hypothetical protein
MTNSVNENQSFEAGSTSGMQDQDDEISLLDLLGRYMIFNKLEYFRLALHVLKFIAIIFVEERK